MRQFFALNDKNEKMMSIESTPDQIKVPPHSLEAEQSVLGGLMLDNQAWDHLVSILQETDFYRQEHQIIFAAMRELFQKGAPVDVLTLVESLKVRNQIDQAGGELYLFELAKNTPSASNVLAYANIVRERSVLRQLIQVAGSVADLAFHPDGRDSHDVLDVAERSVFSIAQQHARGTGPVGIAELLTKAADRIDTLFHSDNPITGLSTGFTDLDDLTSGLQPADLVIVAGRPSMGKTVFAVNIAEHAAIKEQKPVLIFSMEMPGEAIATRMIASLGRIEQHALRTGKLSDSDWPRISSAVSLLSDVKLFVDDTPALSPSEIRSRARRVMRQHGSLGLIVIDYLQLMQLSGYKENRTAEISEISRTLKAIAKELSVPVVALSQLNRSLEQRTDKRPVMSDLRESGAIEQDADLIAFIYRDEVYNEESPQKGVAEIIIAKQRNGPIGKILLTFTGKYARFDNHQYDNYGMM